MTDKKKQAEDSWIRVDTRLIIVPDLKVESKVNTITKHEIIK